MAMDQRDVNNKLNIRAGYYSVGVSSILFIIKIIVGLLSNSIAILASALDSAFDFLTSSVNLYAIKHAQKPADQAHRFGHGKAEALAGFIQSIVIFLSGLYLVYESVRRLFNPKEISNLNYGVLVMGVSMALTWLLVAYQKKVQKQSSNMVVAADRLHYITDLLTNGVVLVSLGINFFYPVRYFDAIAAIGVAAFIMKGSVEIFRQSFDILMDRDISDKYRDDIRKVIDKISDEVIGYHDLRSRSAGDVDFLEFHLEITPDMTVYKSHEIVEKIMYSLKNIHPNLEIMVHTDPAEHDETSGKVKLYDREKPRFY